MLTNSFMWSGDLYRFNQPTLLHWPRARLIACPQDDGGLRVMTNDAQFVVFAQTQGCSFDSEHAVEQQCLDCRRELSNRGYTVWSVQEAMACVTGSPQADEAAALVACLEQWFFIQKSDA